MIIIRFQVRTWENDVLVWVVVSKIFLFLPLLGEMIQFDEHIFQMGGSTTN